MSRAPSDPSPAPRSASPRRGWQAGAGALLGWFDAHRRELPWRRDRDPYRVWVSEVMLQQTRVETVLPYYQRFLARYPTIESLAAAELDEVLAGWSGLGYYRRARQMHATARRVAAAGGRFPDTAQGLAELPGIGAYTAAAVASIAFGESVPVLDGNVERVTARLLALAADPKAAGPRRRLLAAAAALLDPRRPGDGNQALMELGATLCTPLRPRCPLCPLRPAADGFPGCAAARQGEPELYPPPRRRRPTVIQRRLVAVVEQGDRLLLFRRPQDSPLLAGTWELPWVELTAAGDRLAATALGERYGGVWEIGRRLGEARHGITYRSLTLEARRARLAAGELAEGRTRLAAGWFSRHELAGLPLSSMVGKVVALLG